jgi:hypothetical protein
MTELVLFIYTHITQSITPMSEARLVSTFIFIYWLKNIFGWEINKIIDIEMTLSYFWIIILCLTLYGCYPNGVHLKQTWAYTRGYVSHTDTPLNTRRICHTHSRVHHEYIQTFHSHAWAPSLCVLTISDTWHWGIHWTPPQVTPRDGDCPV